MKGLVWTPEGSSLIQFRVITRKGSGQLMIHGDIGDDTLSTTHIIFKLLDSLNEFDLTEYNIHLHIPREIDGVSATLPMLVGIYSALAKKPVNQRLAFTGELSMDGYVLAVDKIEEKIMAAYRAKLEAIVMPSANIEDLPNVDTVPPWFGMALAPVVHFKAALKIAQQ